MPCHESRIALDAGGELAGFCASCRAELRARRSELLERVWKLRELRAVVHERAERSRWLRVRLTGHLERIRVTLGLCQRPLTILVVDDDSAVRDSLRLLLEHLGARAVMAQDGEEALAVAEAERPDLILTDLRMPRLDGWQLAERLRRSVWLGSTSIIAVSAYVSDQDADRLRAVGFDGWLPKPFHPDQLFSILEAARRRLAA